MSEALRQHIANLNNAQRVGLAAAVGLSSLAVYTTAKHRSVCGDTPFLNSPHHEEDCPLTFLAPRISSAMATVQDAFDIDDDTFRLPETPSLPTPAELIPGLRVLPREPLLGCAHDEGFSAHPHSHQCLQCNHGHRASTVLDRAYMDWSHWTTPEPEEPSRTSEERCEASSSSSSSSSDAGSPASEAPIFENMITAVNADVATRSWGLDGSELAGDGGVSGGAGASANAGSGGGSGAKAGVGKTALYCVAWCLSTLCNDQ